MQLIATRLAVHTTRNQTNFLCNSLIARENTTLRAATAEEEQEEKKEEKKEEKEDGKGGGGRGRRRRRRRRQNSGSPLVLLHELRTAVQLHGAAEESGRWKERWENLGLVLGRRAVDGGLSVCIYRIKMAIQMMHPPSCRWTHGKARKTEKGKTARARKR